MGRRRPQCPYQRCSATTISREILLRVAFPTTLVHAALVCRRWLRHASAPAFLRRFRGLHPPRLLGYYVKIEHAKSPRFVPVPRPPELAAAVRSSSFDLDALGCNIMYLDCWNHLLLVKDMMYRHPRTTVHCPLDPARDVLFLPPTLETSVFSYSGILLNGGDVEGPSYFYCTIRSKKQQITVDVYALQDGAWAVCTSAVIDDISQISMPKCISLSGSKIYGVFHVDGIHKLLLLDLVSSCLSLVEFPEEVEHNWGFALSPPHESRVHLANVKGFQLRILVHRMDSDGVGNWILVDTVCLRQICANHMIPTCTSEDGLYSFVSVHAVGVNSDFVFFEMDDVLYLIDMKCKAVRKVLEVPEDKCFYGVYPLMMVWPPKFPVMTEGYNQLNNQAAR